MAFLGRYGHQPAAACLGMTVTDMRELSAAVAKLMGEEAPSMKGPADA